MPKSAATFFGLALIAVSIGFNIWRYPIVWRMTSPTGSSAATSAGTTPTTPKPAPPAAVEPSGGSAVAAPVQPIKPPPSEPRAATPPLMLAASEPPRPIVDAARIAATDAVAAAKRAEASSSTLEKPMVPIPRLVVTAGPIGTCQAVGEVRRLPPVDPYAATLIGTNDSGPLGAIPTYPSTGIR
jgi:hypothetical protein